MSTYYKDWTVVFTDKKMLNPSPTDENDRNIVEVMLRELFSRINKASGETNGTVDVDNLKLLREGESFEYTLYISLNNAHSGGYSRMMFDQKAAGPMRGAHEFKNQNFEIIHAYKG